MKKLLGPVAVALALSFAVVSVGWAAPAQKHEQRKQKDNEQAKKSVKQSPGFKHQQSAGKTRIKSPLNHSRSQVKNNGLRVIPQKTAVKPNTRSPVGNGDRHHAPRQTPPHGQHRFAHRDNPAIHSVHFQHRGFDRWPDGDNWHRRFHDWSWLSTHRVRDLGVGYADEYRERAVYIHYQPEDGDYLFLLETRYGRCDFRERHYCHGYHGWCYYWFRDGSVFALFLGDGGYTRVYIWQRAEAESQAVALGFLTPDLQIVYSRYVADMPPDLAADYAQGVLWSTVDGQS